MSVQHLHRRLLLFVPCSSVLASQLRPGSHCPALQQKAISTAVCRFRGGNDQREDGTRCRMFEAVRAMDGVDMFEAMWAIHGFPYPSWELRALAFAMVIPILIHLERLFREIFRTAGFSQPAVYLLSIAIGELTVLRIVSRGKATDAFAEWPELRGLRFVKRFEGLGAAMEVGDAFKLLGGSDLASETEAEHSIMKQAIFVRHSMFASPIWFKAVSIPDGSYRWFWTPYVQRKSGDWMPVSETKVNTRGRRFGVYSGQTPAHHNVLLIHFLSNNEPETAKAALQAS